MDVKIRQKLDDEIDKFNVYWFERCKKTEKKRGGVEIGYEKSNKKRIEMV